jgi:hypothetical protein
MGHPNGNIKTGCYATRLFILRVTNSQCHYQHHTHNCILLHFFDFLESPKVVISLRLPESVTAKAGPQSSSHLNSYTCVSEIAETQQHPNQFPLALANG